MVGSTSDASRPTEAGVDGYRWVVCGLLFFAATVNYVDRQVLGILKPYLAADLKWNEIDYSNVVFWFQTAYAIGLLCVGRLMDRLGTRRGFSLAVTFWSFAAIAHSFASSVMTFSVARFALGIGEAGNFPAAIKTVAEWFPKRERALATGIFNSGTNVGAVLTPLFVPWIVGHYGWRLAFVVTGATGFIWLVAWRLLYPSRGPRLRLDDEDEREGASTARVPWRVLLSSRQAWAFVIGKFLTDPAWWFYLFWIPGFLHDTYKLPLDSITSGIPIVVIYLAADVGSIGGGFLSSMLIRSGWTVNAGRKTALFVCGACVIPVMFTSFAASMWAAVGLIALGAAAHQGWSANLFTTVSDMFPRRAVGSVIGLGGFAGAVGGMLIAKVTGYVLDATGSYMVIFAIVGSTYLFALLLIHILVPRLEPAALD